MLWALIFLAVGVAGTTFPLVHLSSQTLSKRSITGNNLDFLPVASTYAIAVEVGTPPVRVVLEVSSAVGGLWTFAPGTCWVDSPWDRRNSSSFVIDREEAMSSGLNYTYGHDTVAFDGQTYEDFRFVSIQGKAGNTASAQLCGGSGRAHGVFGLRYDLNASKGDSVLEEAFKRPGMERVAGLFLSDRDLALRPDTLRLDGTQNQSSAGELSIGRLNSSLYTGDITWLPKAPSANTSEWTNDSWVPFEGMSINGKLIEAGNKSVSAHIEPGDARIFVTPEIAKAVHAAIPGSSQFADSDPYSGGDYFFPCNTTANISIRLGGKDWAIAPINLIDGYITEKPGMCTSSIKVDKIEAIISLGAPFLRNVYTVFNYANDSSDIGLATLAQGVNTRTLSDLKFTDSSNNVTDKPETAGNATASGSALPEQTSRLGWTDQMANATTSAVSTAGTTSSPAGKNGGQRLEVAWLLAAVMAIAVLL